MNKLLIRQALKHWGSLEQVPAEIKTFLDVVDETYNYHERDRTMLLRSIDLTSDEMVSLNDRLRKEAQELSKAHNELQTLFRNIETVFFTVDMTKYRVIQMSPSCEKIYGYTPEDFLDTPSLWFDVVLEEDKHIIESNYALMYAGKSFSHEHRIQAKDGTIRWIETKITPTMSAEWKVVRIDGITIDITAKKEAEEHARQNEKRFQKLIEKGHDGITLLDAEGRLRYISPSIERILGYQIEELINTDPFHLIHSDDREAVVQLLGNLANQPGASVKKEYRVKSKPGEWRWISSTITNLLHEKGINAFVFNYEDITERKHHQEQLEFNRRNREALINSTTDLMWSFDSEARLMMANRAFLDATKYIAGFDIKQGDALIAEGVSAEATLEKWKVLYKRVLSGESFMYENHEEVPFDTWGELSFNPIFENGKVIGGSCLWRDITEKKRSNERLIANEKMMTEAQRIARFGSWELQFDASGNILPDSMTWSQEVYRIYGHDPETHVPHYDDQENRVYPQDQLLVSEWFSSVQQGDSPGSIDYRLLTCQGEIRWVKTTADLLRDEQTGKRIKVVGTIQDITERKEFEVERAQVTRDLFSRNKALEQFAHIVSHNLRAPVANIIGLSNLMRLPSSDTHTQLQCVNGLAISAQRLDEIIKDLNKILLVKRGITEEKDAVVLSELVSSIEDSIWMTLQEEKVVINTDFSEVGELFTIKNYLHSIFFNLISNSIKYRRPTVPPVIDISSRTENGKIIVSFKDNCSGIDLARHGDNVFGLYKRFHHNVEGKGLGLYMVKVQAESLGGKIGIKSEVNKGTEITIEFESAA